MDDDCIVMEYGSEQRQLGSNHIVESAGRGSVHVRISGTISPPWTELTPVQVGGDGAPEAYVLVSANGEPKLRIDIHAYSSGHYGRGNLFQQAILWQGWIAAGVGSRVHLVALTDGQVRTVPLLSDWFEAFYPTAAYLLVLSGQGLIRINPDGSVRLSFYGRECTTRLCLGCTVIPRGARMRMQSLSFEDSKFESSGPAVRHRSTQPRFVTGLSGKWHPSPLAIGYSSEATRRGVVHSGRELVVQPCREAPVHLRCEPLVQSQP